MVFEIAQIDVIQGSEAEFEAAVAKAKPLFLRSKGCQGLDLVRSVEKPCRYRLLVRWATVENHTVDFRNSPEFTEWRALASPFFAAPPEVEHAEPVELAASAL